VQMKIYTHYSEEFGLSAVVEQWLVVATTEKVKTWEEILRM